MRDFPAQELYIGMQEAEVTIPTSGNPPSLFPHSNTTEGE